MTHRFTRHVKNSVLCAGIIAGSFLGQVEISQVLAQDVLPYDNSISTYHTAPRYRESESHPLRVFAYVLHPVGWALREGIFRPLSYFASSSETRRSVMGFREPFDYRRPECFSSDDSVPDCHSVTPFNYAPSNVEGADELGDGSNTASSSTDRQVYFPDVNFDFNKKRLNDLGKGRAFQLAQMLKNQSGLKVVLQGYADFKGSEEYNQKLGLDRAEAVKSELLALGVSAERLSTVSFGETQPALAQQEDWARAVNRRVEVHPAE